MESLEIEYIHSKNKVHSFAVDFHLNGVEIIATYNVDETTQATSITEFLNDTGRLTFESLTYNQQVVIQNIILTSLNLFD